MNKKTEAILILALYLAVLYVWVQPISHLPFGDVDSTTHFALADTFYYYDASVYYLPYNLNFTYGYVNEGKIWYPPQYHLNGAISQFVGGERIKSLFFYIALTCSIIVLTSFVLIRKLYGFWPAFLSSFLLGFSTRDYLTYLWAQWPQAIAYFYIPLILYCYYMYTKHVLEKDEKPIYFYIMAVLLATQFFFHPQGFFHSVLIMFIFTVWASVRHKRLSFNIKHAIIAVVIFAIFMLPFLQFPLSMIQDSAPSEANSNLGRLFSWYPPDNLFEGFPTSFYHYSPMYSLWTLPLLLIGIISLLLKRQLKDILLLSWLVGQYLLSHFDIIGMGARVPRSIAAEAHIFIPLIAIGLWFLISLIKVSKSNKVYVKYGFILLFLILGFIFNVKPAYNALSTAYSDLGRITDDQLLAADWLNANVPDDKIVADYGTLSLPKVKWLRQLSRRAVIYSHDAKTDPDYLLFDYSDLVKLQSYPQYKSQMEGISQIERNANATLMYNKNNIKVYKID